MKRITAVVFILFCVISIPSTAAARDVIRLTLELSDTGEGKFRIEKTSQPPADDFSGTPFEFSNWPTHEGDEGKRRDVSARP